jgi:uncharacterized protein (DUF488 family)
MRGKASKQAERAPSPTRGSRQRPDFLFARQRLLLELLDAIGGSVARLDFQKLLFLYCQEKQVNAYEFVPYRFGAFSFTSYADRRRLQERGFLVADEQRWALTAKGESAARTHSTGPAEFGRRYRHLRGEALVVEAYRRFPYYAIRSEIATRVLEHDPRTLASIERARPRPLSAQLTTIGYQGRSIEQYLNELLRAGVTLLCDVRGNPISRKYGFSKTTLARACEGIGIRYEHIPSLGIVSEQRRGLESQADYDEVFAHYRRSSLPRQSTGLQQIVRWLEAGERVSLTCFERLPNQCHRHCVAEALPRMSRLSAPAIHL